MTMAIPVLVVIPLILSIHHNNDGPSYIVAMIIIKMVVVEVLVMLIIKIIVMLMIALYYS